MLAAGQSIGNYRILSKIGTGGMGAVYLAEHPLIGKKVALKVIHRELAGNRDVVSRFFQEARAVNSIGNDHIVEIHDFGVTPEGDHFFIMEYLEGQTLASVLARSGKLEVMRSLHIGAQIAGALVAAHAAGIIHRDLKPDNVMLLARLGETEFVKVLDFGLAKVFSAQTAVKTAAGVLLGTPQYMSPEACESKGDVDHRTDIYALGVLLFQMMTGVLPFDGQTMGEVLVKQVTTLPPAPRAINPSIPPSVEQVLLRCLAKRVDARFQTMQQLRDALLDPEAYLATSPPIAPARSVSRAAIAAVAETLIGGALDAPPHAQPTRIADGPQPAPRPPGPEAAQGATLLGHQVGGVSGRPTANGAAVLPHGTSALPQPQELKMNTMRIATPLGYSSRPPRRVWPIVFGLAALLGVVGGLAVTRCTRDGVPAVATTGSAEQEESRGAAEAAQPMASPGSAAGFAAAVGSAPAADPVVAASDATAAVREAAGAAGSGAAASAAGANSPPDRSGVPAPPRSAHLLIDSVPTGAQVSGPDGERLGTTPLRLDWPISDLPVTFELVRGGFKKRLKRTVVNGNTTLHIALERIQPPPQRHRSGSKPTPADGHGDLMRPD